MDGETILADTLISSVFLSLFDIICLAKYRVTTIPLQVSSKCVWLRVSRDNLSNTDETPEL